MERTSEYLVVLYSLEQQTDPPIAPSRVATALDRAPSTTTEHLQRMAANGLVDYEPYTGVSLTDSGHQQAADLYDVYETLCRFFQDVLELDDACREARPLAGAVSPIVARRLETAILDTGTTMSNDGS